MASITSVVFDKAAYAPGDTVTLTVTYVPDTPSVVQENETATVNLTDPSGNLLAGTTAAFTVNTPQAGDLVTVTDTGNHAWVQASDTGSVAVFTTIA